MRRRFLPKHLVLGTFPIGMLREISCSSLYSILRARLLGPHGQSPGAHRTALSCAGSASAVTAKGNEQKSGHRGWSLDSNFPWPSLRVTAFPRAPHNSCPEAKARAHRVGVGLGRSRERAPPPRTPGQPQTPGEQESRGGGGAGAEAAGGGGRGGAAAGPGQGRRRRRRRRARRRCSRRAVERGWDPCGRDPRLPRDPAQPQRTKEHVGAGEGPSSGRHEAPGAAEPAPRSCPPGLRGGPLGQCAAALPAGPGPQHGATRTPAGPRAAAAAAAALAVSAASPAGRWRWRRGAARRLQARWAAPRVWQSGGRRRGQGGV